MVVKINSFKREFHQCVFAIWLDENGNEVTVGDTIGNQAIVKQINKETLTFALRDGQLIELKITEKYP